MFMLTGRTYVNRDSTKVVPEGSVDAAWLLGLAGDEISDETAKRLGLVAAAAPAATAYADLRVAELRDLAESRGIELDAHARKAEIIEALEGADATAATGGTADVGAGEV